MFNIRLIHIISSAGVVVSAFWLWNSPNWEPAATFIASLVTFVGTLPVNPKINDSHTIWQSVILRQISVTRCFDCCWARGTGGLHLKLTLFFNGRSLEHQKGMRLWPVIFDQGTAHLQRCS